MASYADRIPPGLIGNTIARHREIAAVRRAFSGVSKPHGAPRSLDSCRRDDPDNGLYDFLDLLVLLRSSQASDAALPAQLSKLSSASSAHLYVLQQRQVIEDALRREKVLPRRAAVVAWESCAWLQQSEDTALRELARLLFAKASTWREAGRTADAIRAHAAIVRLATDLAKDSPSPGTALLASELTESGCRELARDYTTTPAGSHPAGATVASNGPSPSRPDPQVFEKEASKAAALSEAWHRIVDKDGVGVLPWMGASIHVLLAKPEHDRVMAFMVASASALVCSVTMLGLLVLAGIAALAARMPPDVELKSRLGRRGSWPAALLPILPLLVLPLFLAIADLDFTWLLSAPSLVGLAFIPAWAVISVGLVVYGSFVVVEKTRRYAWSMVGVSVAAVVVVLTLVLVSFAVGGDVSWRPPKAVREIRTAGAFVSALCVLLIVVWAVANVRRAIRGRFSLAVLGRAFLPVAAAGFLYASVLSFSLLWVNDTCNTTHQQAFARAAVDPVGDRLGSNWYRDHLAGARALVETIESR